MAEHTGRAAKREATARRILDAARAEFAEHGLQATTVRAIARRAGVDPSLVLQHYGSKDKLFALAINLGTEWPDEDVAAHLARVLDVRLDEPSPQVRALVRSMLTAPEATSAMKAFLDDRTRNLAATTDDPDADLRAALTVTSILGLVVARHFLRLDALADISDEQVERIVRPWAGAAMPETPGNAPDEPSC
ncbi:TetR/AcrR family transcriptional regulator [Actinomadura rayongensis]|uniref:TetR family transcriptional regulator n=1 Tax=Actinomadura rayongensis TaxID=1429076 RepID=A0A6I4W866_9ACTN|nr:TetR/AcrR family transcriptional regulator [Actinomadura rayongensis]MXQ64445.1 TetR family transcriptional regulator [Actinomadura rayongensis]